MGIISLWNLFFGREKTINSPVEGEFNSFSEFCDRPNPVYKKGRNGQYQCPCCFYFTLSAPAIYDICAVCFWEDDGTTSEHYFSPNGISLEEGRENYKKFGTSREHDKEYCRAPLESEK